MKCVAILIIIINFTACRNKQNTAIPVKGNTSLFRNKNLISESNLQADTNRKVVCEFIAYNDDYDYFMLYVRNNKRERFFINEVESRNLLRGDIIEVAWKADTIYIAGDGESPEPADFAIAVKKIKDGNVALFRKKYPEAIRFHHSNESSYSTEFKNKIYLLVEYYLANTEKEILLDMLHNRFSNIIYSIEEREMDDEKYMIIGIADEAEHYLNTVQWLYLQPESYKIYEIDFANDELVVFDK